MDDSKTRPPSFVITRLEPLDLRPRPFDPSRRRLRVVVNEPDPAIVLADYLAAAQRFETSRACRLATELADQVSLHTWLFEFVLPALRARPEPLVSAQLRACLLARQQTFSPAANAPRLVAAGSSGKRNEVALLIGSLIALARGFEVAYLGVDVPLDELAWCVHECQPEVLLLAGERDHVIEDIPTVRLADFRDESLQACDDALAAVLARS